nr:type VI secretion system-associated protein TagF [uncultured Pseudomonas sp.]
MDQKDSRTGFFGKLVTQGDFVSRRLSPLFVREWDDWLQVGLKHSQKYLGDRWQKTYLCSPIWHFALAAGVCGEPAWAGVMMPSVDRVGRFFPLTVAYGGPDVPVIERLRRDGHWYAEAERLTLSSLEEGFSLEHFDATLSRLRSPSRPTSWSGEAETAKPAAGALWLELSEQEGMMQAVQHWLVELAGATQNRSLAGHALFWTEGSSRLAPTLILSQGLPSMQTFAGMLAGKQCGD